MAKLFSSRHKGTKTLRKNHKIKSFVPSACPVGPEDRTGVPWWQIFLGFPINRDFRFATIGLSRLRGLSGLGQTKKG